MEKIGIRQIAEEAGVSIGTVSKAFNPTSRSRISMAPETRERIFAAARKFNYIPNYGAALLRQQSTRTIGAAISLPDEELATPLSDYTLRLLNGLLQAAVPAGYQVLLLSGNDYGQYLDSRRIDGLFFVCFRPSVNPHAEEMVEMFEHLNQRKYPYVVMNNTDLSVHVPTIRVDETSGIRQIADHMIRQGYSSAGFIGELQEIPSVSSCARLTLLREMLKDSPVRLEERACLNGPTPLGARPRSGLYCHADGACALEYLIEQRLLPRVVLCTNDDVAAGVLATAAARGVRIPEELAVIGYDGNPTAEYLVPSLTTLVQPLEQFGETAFDLLMRQMKGSEYFADIVVQPVLQVRNSG